MFFDSWSGLFRILIIGAAAYVALILMLRISGKRTLSKMNAFDLIITVALGSTFATVVLDKSVPLAEGVLGLALLICLQYAITWISVRSMEFQGLVKAAPTLLLRNGQYLDAAMRDERVTRAEIEAAVREQGIGDPSEAACVVLETDGTLSVIPERRR
jgi:uncharacterized membrane protein YcaP (DUF421 family)